MDTKKNNTKISFYREIFPEYVHLEDKFRSTMFNDGYSDNTIKSYIYAFWQFVFFCKHMDISVEDANDDTLAEFLNYLKKNLNISKRTALVKYSAIKYLLNRILKKDIRLVFKFRIKTSERVRKMKVPSEEDIKKYIEYLARKEPMLYRLLMFIYGVGLRISEALNLKWEDINIEEGHIRVFGKGGKIRFVPIPIYLKSLIKFWKKTMSIESESEYVFPGRNNKPLTRAAVDKLLKKTQYEVFGKKKFSAHSFRHGFATHFLKIHRDIFLLSRILGHSNINITTIYTHIVPHKEKVILPLDKLMIK